MDEVRRSNLAARRGFQLEHIHTKSGPGRSLSKPVDKSSSSISAAVSAAAGDSGEYEVVGAAYLLRRVGSNISSISTSISLSWCSLKSPSSSLRPPLVRAIPIWELLSGFGRHWTNGTPSDYQLSETVDTLHDWISHDGRTDGVGKAMALCYVYNRYPACIASCAAAVPVGYLGAVWSIPLAKLVCPVIWITVLAFWQRMRQILLKPRYAFLDKVCIHQTDLELQKAAIMSFSSIVGASERMLVLWSPQYFSRSWCAYELAAWCHHRGTESGHVRVVPVPCATLHFLFTVILMFQDTIALMFLSVGFHSAAASILGVLMLAPVLARMAQVVADIIFQVHQLQHYDICHAHCCCSACRHVHHHPGTKQQIPCERKLVIEALRQWTMDALADDCFAPPVAPAVTPCLSTKHSFETVDRALDNYNSIVRYRLSGLMRSRLNSKLVISSYMECAANAVPVVWACCDYCWPLLHRGDYHEAVRWLIEYSSVFLFVFPLGVFCTVQLAMRLSGRMAPAASWRARASSTMATLLIFPAVTSLLLLSGPTFLIRGLPDVVSDSLMMLRYVLLALVTTFCMLRNKVQPLEVPTSDSVDYRPREHDVSGFTHDAKVSPPMDAFNMSGDALTLISIDVGEDIQIEENEGTEETDEAKEMHGQRAINDTVSEWSIGSEIHYAVKE
eukprot:TRINITY_DN32426_c0_g1_i3.p1 TRINITY_DN32426_c0_g1~~TRINITY_DN32426_c0_g1_i3.p1  ORF type:complete len:673 (+),score=56.65 TRINITY_DN32426_c0_g1_i3:108-2126(+)